ncbi:MAG TPA: VOC family protein [Arthrobacter sp.]|nr:VOC family protein [Arthrobacter sp.]
MAPNTFVSLPTSDLAAADTSYAALGFEKNTDFSNEQESFLGFSCDSREEVDRLTAAAAANGGALYREAAEEMPGMYASAVTDPDGRAWELMWMEQAG